MPERGFFFSKQAAATSTAIHDPQRMGELWHSPDDWDYYTMPQSHAAGRRLHWPRGKVLGGSHSLNAMFWVRGTPADYDGWETDGCPGWSWRDVLPVFREIEDFDGGESEFRGAGGPLDVRADYPLHPVQQSIIDAAVQWDLPHNPDYNGASIDGVSQQQLTARGERRLSTYRAYVQPVLAASPLTLETGAKVSRLLVEDGRASGVEYVREGERRTAHAALVVLCSGAIDTPAVLLRSGIGPADELRGLGIDVTADSPFVGANLHDHLLSPLSSRAMYLILRPWIPPSLLTWSKTALAAWEASGNVAEPLSALTEPMTMSPLMPPALAAPEQPESAMTVMVVAAAAPTAIANLRFIRFPTFLGLVHRDRIVVRRRWDWCNLRSAHRRASWSTLGRRLWRELSRSEQHLVVQRMGGDVPDATTSHVGGCALRVWFRAPRVKRKRRRLIDSFDRRQRSRWIYKERT